MKKWVYKVACFSYEDTRKAWVSVFDNRENPSLEKLVSIYGEEGWELVNVTAELAIPYQESGGVEFQAITTGSRSSGHLLGRIPLPVAENPTTLAITCPAGGFDVKIFRAFFKQEKTKKFLGWPDT